MAALRSLKGRDKSGAYTIKGKGISTSAPSLGAALSKALTIASRIQREIKRQDEFFVLNIKKIGDDALLGRVEVQPDVILTWGSSSHGM